MNYVPTKNIYHNAIIDNACNKTDYVFIEQKEQLFRDSLKGFGTNIVFEDDKWYCDKLIRNENKYAKYDTVYFTQIPEEYKDDIKYYIIYRLSFSGVKDSKDKVGYINKLFQFIEK